MGASASASATPPNCVELHVGVPPPRPAAERAATTGAPSWEHARPEYAVVMPRADCNLQMAVSNERFAGHEPLKARLVLVDLARALQHMHAQGLVHADVKPRNAVRVGGAWKLIDLDAAARTGTPVGRKYSSGFSPPELAQLSRPLLLAMAATVSTTHVPSCMSKAAPTTAASKAPPMTSSSRSSWDPNFQSPRISCSVPVVSAAPDASDDDSICAAGSATARCLPMRLCIPLLRRLG